MNNYNIIFSRRPGTAELVSILFAVCALLFARMNKSTFAAIKAAWQWLFRPETYFASDGEGVTVNGLQIIGINLITAAVCLILSISL
ncbi:MULTISPECIES: hypothetical protein [Bacteria]|uniref:hypothetical protein n=1 Tax=Bacillota TaxID=1239 RepID=UPI003AB60C18